MVLWKEARSAMMATITPTSPTNAEPTAGDPLAETAFWMQASNVTTAVLETHQMVHVEPIANGQEPPPLLDAQQMEALLVQLHQPPPSM